ncbi:exodeoxyribonuclease VII large subunit [Desulfobulbus alkaliphilus]|uniref:exodeoxyribonuclease VII large subunit n=1 Tax=Desulfobulbus alkaliphilus TaxID=869814 RepID=UPI0019647989|nr:exodeoxyribonuclease VII large subunit [Desulfobulbus alkaliphilus]MBM9536332.1 exodeoxyribonuclease VII large subunit [Desulfobulbus alkaliphilus]
MTEQIILTVAELSGSIRSLLEKRYPFVSVIGEISNLHKPYSGHLYFTLKDHNAQIRAVLFKMQQRYLQETPRDGARVICRGRITVYEPRGEYQLIVDAIDFQGTGDLLRQVELLKQKLAAEGLFDEHLKRPPPSVPRHITLITSPRGAAVHDFIRIATRRFPPLDIAIYPVSVQGDRAAAEIILALEEINARVVTDAVALCRGGGSFEDLQAFNNEELARAIRRSSLPVISAVGHEIDFTIADFAADMRAPTPSAAAEILIPDMVALRRHVASVGTRLQRALAGCINRQEQRLALARQRIESASRPLDRLTLRLDQLSLNLELAMTSLLADKKRDLDMLAHRLQRHSPVHRLNLNEQRLLALHGRMIQAIKSFLQTREDQYNRMAGVLHAVSPLATLARGYAIVRKIGQKQTVVTAESQVQQGETVEVLLHKGRLTCRVEEKK